MYVVSEMAKNNYDRSSLVFAVGGGVVGDVAGFAASIFMRGIKYIQYPTTLLSMVDSSIGGKTGINLKDGKNLVGRIYQPIAVEVDTNFLSTLPKRDFNAAFAEVIKYGFIYDKDLFDYLSNNLSNIKNARGSVGSIGVVTIIDDDEPIPLSLESDNIDFNVYPNPYDDHIYVELGRSWDGEVNLTCLLYTSDAADE